MSGDLCTKVCGGQRAEAASRCSQARSALKHTGLGLGSTEEASQHLESSTPEGTAAALVEHSHCQKHQSLLFFNHILYEGSSF